MPKAVDADDEDDDADDSDDSSDDDDEVGGWVACVGVEHQALPVALARPGGGDGRLDTRCCWSAGCQLSRAPFQSLFYPARPALRLWVQDDEAELLAELDRIKRERAEEAAKAAAEAAAKRSAEEQAELIRGNPLLQEKLAAQGGGTRQPACVCACV